MSDQGYDRDPAGNPPGPPADRRLWIVAGILAVIAVIAVALLLTQDDGDDDVATPDTTASTVADTSSSTSTSSTTTSSSTTSTSEATTTTAEVTTTSAAPATTDPAQCADVGTDTDPETPAQTVFIAWRDGDSACARALMTDGAYDQLFARSGAGAQDQFQGCSEQTEGDPHFDCAFTYEGGATHYRLNFSPTDGWKVYDVYQVAD